MIITIDVPNDATLDQVALASKRQWLALHVHPNDNQSGLALRMGITYPGLRYLLRRLGVTISQLVTIQEGIFRGDSKSADDRVCQFCGSLDHIQPRCTPRTH